MNELKNLFAWISEIAKWIFCAIGRVKQLFTKYQQKILKIFQRGKREKTVLWATDKENVNQVLENKVPMKKDKDNALMNNVQKNS